MFERLSGIIKRKKFSFQREVDALEIFDAFVKTIKEIFDSSIAEDCKPLSFKQGVLKVAVSNSTLAQELQVRKNIIIGSINEDVGQTRVKSLLFQLS